MAAVRPIAISGVDATSSRWVAWAVILGMGAFIFWGTMQPARRKDGA